MKLARPGEGVEFSTELGARDQVLRTLSESPATGDLDKDPPTIWTKVWTNDVPRHLAELDWSALLDRPIAQPGRNSLLGR